MLTFLENCVIDNHIADATINSMEIKREHMPQIKADNVQKFKDLLDAHHIEHKAETVPSEDINFAQCNFHKDKIESMIKSKENLNKNGKIFVSSANCVIDDNHRVICAQILKEPIEAIRVNATVKEIILMLKSADFIEYQE